MSLYTFTRAKWPRTMRVMVVLTAAACAGAGPAWTHAAHDTQQLHTHLLLRLVGVQPPAVAVEQDLLQDLLQGLSEANFRFVLHTWMAALAQRNLRGRQHTHGGRVAS